MGQLPARGRKRVRSFEALSTQETHMFRQVKVLEYLLTLV
jgi:hypothetical protein